MLLLHNLETVPRSLHLSVFANDAAHVVVHVPRPEEALLVELRVEVSSTRLSSCSNSPSLETEKLSCVLVGFSAGWL